MSYASAAESIIEALATADVESMRYMLNRIVAVAVANDAADPDQVRAEIEAVWLQYGGQPGVWEVPGFQEP